MKFNGEQITKAAEILEGAKVMVLNRDFDDFQNAIITALNTFALVKELTDENEKLHERLNREARCQYDLCGQIVNLRDDVKYIKADTIRKMQERLEDRVDHTIDVFDFQISECTAIRQVLRGVKNDIYQIAKEVLEENK